MIASLLLFLNVATEDVQVSSLSEFRTAIASAKPGDRILLAPGVYRGGVFVTDVHGTTDRPITIGASDPKSPPEITEAGTGLHLAKVSHLVVQDLAIRGVRDNGINIDDGGEVTKPSHHVTVQRVSVSELPKGNHDGIKLSGLDDFAVKECTLSRWGGSGIDMVGCHRGTISACRFLEGGDSGVQAKGGSSDIAVLGCWFTDFGQRGVNLGGSTGLEFFRPPLSALTEKYEAKDLRVEGCTFVRGGAPVAFVGVDGAVVKHNTIYHPTKWAMRILQETSVAGFVACRNGEFSHNLVVFSSASWGEGGVNIGPGTRPESFRFSGNHWYCDDNPSGSTPRLPTKETSGSYGQDPHVTLGSNGELVVPKDSPAKGAGAHSWKK